MLQLKSFETSRLQLTPTSEGDAEFIFQLFNSPKWLQNIGDRNIKSPTAAGQYIRENMIPQFDRLGYGNYTIRRKSDNLKVGVCGLYDREGLEGIDIGFALLPAFEGTGYALEAARELKRAAIEEFEIKELKAITTRDNKASKTLLQKLGMQHVRDIRLSEEGEVVLLFVQK